MEDLLARALPRCFVERRLTFVEQRTVRGGGRVMLAEMAIPVPGIRQAVSRAAF